MKSGKNKKIHDDFKPGAGSKAARGRAGPRRRNEGGDEVELDEVDVMGRLGHGTGDMDNAEPQNECPECSGELGDGDDCGTCDAYTQELRDRLDSGEEDGVDYERARNRPRGKVHGRGSVRPARGRPARRNADQDEPRHDVLCQCGWGRLQMPESEIPELCPLCGFDLRAHGEGQEVVFNPRHGPHHGRRPPARNHGDGPRAPHPHYLNESATGFPYRHNGRRPQHTGSNRQVPRPAPKYAPRPAAARRPARRNADEPIAEHQRLRHVDLDGYRLATWDTYRRDSLGKWILGYRFVAPNGETIFEGEDFGCAPGDAVDSDESLAGLLGFLTLKPGDTDREYFEDYNERQREFAESEAEALQPWSFSVEDGRPAFVDVDDSDRPVTQNRKRGGRPGRRNGRSFLGFCRNATDKQLEAILEKEWEASKPGTDGARGRDASRKADYEDAVREAERRGWTVERGQRM